MSSVFKGLCFAFAGVNETELKRAVAKHGAESSSIISPKTTHLVTTPDEVKNKNQKVVSAMRRGVFIVGEEFVQVSIAQGIKADENRFLLAESSALTSSAQRPKGWWKAKFVKVKAWQHGTKGEPRFPSDYEIVKSDILQWTDVISNHNKYYSLELHVASEGGREFFRLFTHYGRTGDLESNTDAGRRETRHYTNLDQVEAAYESIIEEKTGKKGYRKVEMASANIGSEKARAKYQAQTASTSGSDSESSEQPKQPVVSSLHPKVQELIEYLYSEATSQLTATVSAKITSRGIETPLGVLNVTQVEKGEAILDQLEEAHREGKLSDSLAESLSSQFYTIIPLPIARSKLAMMAAIMRTPEAFQQKRELLQLMRDMLQLNESGDGVLHSAVVDNKYKALRCNIEYLQEGRDQRFFEIRDHVLNSQVKSFDVEVLNIYSIRREAEAQRFTNDLHNQQLLFHGSRISNWVGLLSRGMLMPKSVTSLGGKRTDYGLLGSGLYFGGNACTSAQYATPGKKGTRFLLLSRVALGNISKLYKIDSSIAEPPAGCHSVQGVSSRHGQASDFKDDEYVIYDLAQQMQEYMVEYRLKSIDPPHVSSDSTSPFSSAPSSSAAPIPLAKPFAIPSSTPVFSSAMPASPSPFALQLPTASSFSFGKKIDVPKKAAAKKEAASESEEEKEEKSPRKTKKAPARFAARKPPACSDSEDDFPKKAAAKKKAASESEEEEEKSPRKTKKVPAKFAARKSPAGSDGEDDEGSDDERREVARGKAPRKVASKRARAPRKVTSLKALRAEKAALKKAAMEGRKKKKDPSAPKRPMTAYLFFASQGRAEVKRANPSLGIVQVSMELANKWKNFSAAERQKYESMAREDRERYERQMAEYNGFGAKEKKSKAVASDEDEEAKKEEDDEEKEEEEEEQKTLSFKRPMKKGVIKTPKARMPKPAKIKKAAAKQFVVEAEEEEPSPRVAHGVFNPERASSLYSDYENLITDEQRATKQEEDHIRQIFAQDRHSSELSDPYLLLLDVFKERSSFTFQADSSVEACEQNQFKLLSQNRPALEELHGRPAVVDEATWRKNWEDFTSGQFKGLDWNNVFIAGGSVMATLDPAYPNVTKGTDIDMFLYGLTESEARDKLRHIFQTVHTNTQGKGDIIRTKNAITIIGGYPNRHIQIILRLYKSPAEVLIGFDIDSCTVGFDGKRVWALPRARRSICRRYNLVDLSRRSLTYESRLSKYSRRGFAVAVPGFEPERVDPALFKRTIKSVHGLAKLVIMDRNATRSKEKAAAAAAVSPDREVRKGRRPGEPGEEGAELEESDYSSVEIPYGPQWMSQSILTLLNKTDKAQFFSTIRKNKASAKHAPVSHIFVSGIDAVLNDSTRMGPLAWLTDNPGRQLLTGSFHPVDDEHWETDCYSRWSPASTPTRYTSPPPVLIQQYDRPAPTTFVQPVVHASPKKGEKMEKKSSKSPKKAATPKKKAQAAFPSSPLAHPQPHTTPLFSSPGASSAPQTHIASPVLISTPSYGLPSPTVTGESTFGLSHTYDLPSFGTTRASSSVADPYGWSNAPSSTTLASINASPYASPSRPATSTASSVRRTQGTSVAEQNLQQVFESGKAPKSSLAKLLLLIATMHKAGRLSVAEKSALKDLAIKEDEGLLCALEVFEVEQDFDEFEDTIRRVLSLQ